MGVESLLFLRLRDNYLKNNLTNNKQEKKEKKISKKHSVQKQKE